MRKNTVCSPQALHICHFSAGDVIFMYRKGISDEQTVVNKIYQSKYRPISSIEDMSGLITEYCILCLL